MKNSGIIIVGAAIAALLLFRKGEGEGGSGGSLSIPLDVLGSGAEVAGAGTQQPSFISKDVLAAMSRKKTVGGSRVSAEFFNASTTPTYGSDQARGDSYISSNPDWRARAAENSAYSNTNYGQLGKSEFGSQFSSSKKAPSSSSSSSSSSGNNTWGGGIYRGYGQWGTPTGTGV